MWNDLLMKPIESYTLKGIRRCNFCETGAESLRERSSRNEVTCRRITGKVFEIKQKKLQEN